MANGGKFGIDKFHIERGVVDHQSPVADKVEKLGVDLRKDRLILQHVGRQTVHGNRFGRDIAFGVDILVIGLAGRHLVHQFNTADLNQAIAFRRLHPRGFGIKNNFTQRSSPLPPLSAAAIPL